MRRGLRGCYECRLIEEVALFTGKLAIIALLMGTRGGTLRKRKIYGSEQAEPVLLWHF